MAKWVSDAVLDAALDVIASCTLMTACSAQPATYTEAATTYKLADVVMAGGDFTKANGDTNGRKVTIAQKTGVSVDTTGDATHVALAISGSSTLHYVTTCTTQTLTGGNTVTFPSWKVELADPS